MSYATSTSNLIKPASTRLWDTPLPFPPVTTSGYTTSPPQPSVIPNFYYEPLLSKPIPWLPTGPVQTAAGPLAQSIPLAPLPELPRPEILAPCVFNNHAPYSYLPPGTSNSYNYNPYAYMPWVQPHVAPVTSPVTPPMQPVNTPPSNKEEPKKEEPSNKPINDLPLLTPDLIQEINANLEASNYETRQQGARTLARVLDKDPDVLSKPQYAKYVEALILKILKDPNSLVRQPLLLSMELGNLNSTTPKIMSALNNLKNQRGLYNFEPGIINGIISRLKVKEAESQRKKAELAVQPTNIPLETALPNMQSLAKAKPSRAEQSLIPAVSSQMPIFTQNNPALVNNRMMMQPRAEQPAPGQRFNMMSS